MPPTILRQGSGQGSIAHCQLRSEPVGYSEWSSSHLRIHMGQRFDTTLLAFESSLNRVGVARATASWASSKLYRPAVRPPGQGGEKPMLKRMSEPKLA